MSNTLPLIVVAAAAITAAAIDLRTRRVPNVLTASIALVGLGIAAAGLGRVGLWLSCAGCLVGLGVMLPGYLIGAMGGGDVKLLAAVGTLLGPGATLRAFVASAIAGGLIAVVVAWRRGRCGAASRAAPGTPSRPIGRDGRRCNRTRDVGRLPHRRNERFTA